MSKSKIAIDTYKVTRRLRDRADHMENRNDDSVWEEYEETKYRIICGKKILADGYSSEQTAKLMLNINWTPEGLRSQRRTLNFDRKIAINKANREYDQALKKLDRQLERIKKLRS